MVEISYKFLKETSVSRKIDFPTKSACFLVHIRVLKPWAFIVYLIDITLKIFRFVLTKIQIQSELYWVCAKPFSS